MTFTPAPTEATAPPRRRAWWARGGALGVLAAGLVAACANDDAAPSGPLTTDAGAEASGRGGDDGAARDSAVSDGAASDALGSDGAALDASDASDAGDSALVDAGPVVVPFSCPVGAEESVFVSERAPPATLAPGAIAPASVTFANCGTKTWRANAAPPDGVRLGPSSPRDIDLFTANRLPLPADVAPGQAVRIEFTVRAPPLTGPHTFAMELVRDGVAWLGTLSPKHTITVTPAAAPTVALCAGHTADPTGASDATAALQACVDATPTGGTLALPPGIFQIAGVVSITHALTLTTQGAAGAPSCMAHDGPACAVLRASAATQPSLAGTRGFLRLGTLAQTVSSVTLDHVVIDGNRASRLPSSAASACAAGQNGDGINVGANCASCSIVAVTSARALCGSGMEWDGDALTVQGSSFWGNGDHDTTNMWSDGLTIHKSNASSVTGSRFVDNSDVGFISGGGTSAHYTGNEVLQISQAAFAGMMLDNFNSAALGDHTGAELTNNVVTCPAGCHFGIELGPHPWYASPNIAGGTVSGNTVLGALIQINAQGAGTVAAPTVIGANTLGSTPTSGAFICQTVSGLSPLNVSSESVVTFTGGAAATGSISVPCP